MIRGFYFSSTIRRFYLKFHDGVSLLEIPWLWDLIWSSTMGRLYSEFHDGEILFEVPWWKILFEAPWWTDFIWISMRWIFYLQFYELWWGYFNYLLCGDPIWSIMWRSLETCNRTAKYVQMLSEDDRYEQKIFEGTKYVKMLSEEVSYIQRETEVDHSCRIWKLTIGWKNLDVVICLAQKFMWRGYLKRLAVSILI